MLLWDRPWLMPELLRGETVDGMITVRDAVNGDHKIPGRVLALMGELRKRVGPIEAKEKKGVRFKVRSAEDLEDAIREVADELGLIIGPVPVVLNDHGEAVFTSNGKSTVLEDGALAELNLAVMVRAIEDGSCIVFYGFGLAADNQDKAAGKVMTYAKKYALIQALLAGGRKNAKALGVHDTDDTDTPIAGGVRKPAPPKTGLESLKRDLAAVQSEEDYNELRPTLQALGAEDQNKLRSDILRARERAGIPLPAKKE